MKKEIVQIVLRKHRNIVKTRGGKNRIEQVKPLYQLWFGELPATQKKYTVVDKNFRLQHRGKQNLVLYNPTEKQKEKLLEYEQWKGDVEGTVVFLVDSYNARQEFRRLQEKGECWKDLVDRFVDDTEEGKSPVMVDVVKAHIVSVPRGLGSFQKYNNHSIVLAKSKTGKTVSFQRIGCFPSQDPTVAGMIGSVEKDYVTVIQGTLNGSGLAVYDEFPEWGDPVVNHLLNYLEIGETIRELVTSVECRGNKALVFLGNYDRFTENDFLKNIQGLATGKSLDRVGSRFAHIIFQELRPVVPQFSDNKFVGYMRKLVESTLNQHERKIMWIMKYAEKWFSRRDGDYEGKLNDLIFCVKDRRIKMFLDGCRFHVPRLKMGALKKAIIENLDRIVLCYSKTLKRDVLEEAKRNYETFKLYNLDSFDNFVYDKKLKFRTLVDSGLTRKQIVLELHISRDTFYRWKKQLKGEHSD